MIIEFRIFAFYKYYFKTTVNKFKYDERQQCEIIIIIPELIGRQPKLRN